MTDGNRIDLAARLLRAVPGVMFPFEPSARGVVRSGRVARVA